MPVGVGSAGAASWSLTDLLTTDQVRTMLEAREPGARGASGISPGTRPVRSLTCGGAFPDSEPEYAALQASVSRGSLAGRCALSSHGSEVRATPPLSRPCRARSRPLAVALEEVPASVDRKRARAADVVADALEREPALTIIDTKLWCISREEISFRSSTANPTSESASPQPSTTHR